MKLARVATLLAAGLAAAPVSSDEAPPLTSGLKKWVQDAHPSGSLRTGYWTSSRNLDDRKGLGTLALRLQASPRLGSRGGLVFEGWLSRSGLFHESQNDAAVREAYVDLSFGPVDFRLGKQALAWGRADRINPTDNLTPKDLTLLVPEDGDQRLGRPAARVSYYVGRVSVAALWLPDFEPTVYPIRKPPAPVTLRERLPARTLGQGAVKIEQTGKAVDWSLSYFSGFDLTPNLEIERAGASGVDLALSYQRVGVVGADAATTLGGCGLRGEAAYTFTTEVGHEAQAKHPFLFMVIGGDRTFHDVNVNLQYSLRVVSRFRNPVESPDPLQRSVAMQQAILNNQVDRVSHGASVRIGRKWSSDTFEAELSGMVSFTRRDYVIRPRLIYAFSDRWKGTLGADLFRGSETSFFGRVRDNSGLYTELRWSF